MSATGSVARRLKTLQTGVKAVAATLKENAQEDDDDMLDAAAALQVLVYESEAGDVDPAATRESAE